MERVRTARGFAALLVAVACGALAACATGGEGGSDVPALDGSPGGPGVDAGGDGGGGFVDDAGGDGGSTGDDGGGGDGSTGDASSSAGPPGRSLASGATVSTSPSYKAIRTLGQAPGGNGTGSSSNYRFHGGLVGATQ